MFLVTDLNTTNETNEGNLQIQTFEKSAWIKYFTPA